MKRAASALNLDPEEGSSTQQSTGVHQEHADIIKQLKAKTKATTFASVRQRHERLKKKVKVESQQAEASSSSSQNKRFKPSNKKKRGVDQSFDERLWTIGGAKNQLIVHFSKQKFSHYDRWYSDYSCASTISVYQLDAQTDVDAIRSYKCDCYRSEASQSSFAKIAVSGSSMIEYEPHHHHRDPDRYDSSGCDSEYDDSGVFFSFESNSLDNEVELLDIDGLTQDILIKYIITLVQPRIDAGAESELKSEVNSLNKTGSPKDDIWYAIWKMNLNKK